MDAPHYHIHIHVGDQEVSAKLDLILDLLQPMSKDVKKMTQAMDDLQAADTAMGVKVDAAALVMADAAAGISDLAAKITAAGTDPVALQAITADLTTHSTSLQTASDSLSAALTAARAGDTPPTV